MVTAEQHDALFKYLQDHKERQEELARQHALLEARRRTRDFFRIYIRPFRSLNEEPFPNLAEEIKGKIIISHIEGFEGRSVRIQSVRSYARSDDIRFVDLTKYTLGEIATPPALSAPGNRFLIIGQDIAGVGAYVGVVGALYFDQERSTFVEDLQEGKKTYHRKSIQDISNFLGLPTPQGIRAHLAFIDESQSLHLFQDSPV